MIPKIPLKVLYTFCAIFAVLIFVIDVFMFLVNNENISIVEISLSGFQEVMILLLVLGWALIIRQILPRDQLGLAAETATTCDIPHHQLCCKFSASCNHRPALCGRWQRGAT